MGSIGAAKSSNPQPRNTINEWEERPTKDNEYGFEVEDSRDPELEFSDNVWKEMAELRSLGHFEDYDLSRLVDDRIYELVDQYGDLERYDSDLTSLRERLEENAVTTDEYWAGYHVMANMLGIQSPRYIAGEGGEDYGYADTRFGSEEQAAEWGQNRDLTHVIDTWTGKYRKIGGKNWRKS